MGSRIFRAFGRAHNVVRNTNAGETANNVAAIIGTGALYSSLVKRYKKRMLSTPKKTFK
jgi:hypothetical protein